MELFTEDKFCKYCEEKLEVSFKEGLECTECKTNVHSKCLKRGSVPGGLYGDVFFTFTCQECSPKKVEVFSRIKLSWLQIVVLVLYHLHYKSPGLARKGFFHWRHHIGKFIDKNWEILFSSDIKKRKKWTGTVAGILSHFSNYIFLSGNAILNKPAVWALMYPKLTPYAVSCVYSVMKLEKQNVMNRKQTIIPDSDLFHITVRNCISKDECLQRFTDTQKFCETKDDCDNNVELENVQIVKQKNKRKNMLPQISRKMMKLSNCESESSADLPTISSPSDFLDNSQNLASSTSRNDDVKKEEYIELDPKWHFNTCYTDISKRKGISLYTKLMGGIGPEFILSPYSGIHLKPYIRRDIETFPPWLKLMAEIKIVVNEKDKNYILLPRAPLDFKYVQPEHIPAINSLCNHFFWPGIDMTETLQYPDFSCVVLYKRLIVAFAFAVPDVTYTENYISFMFTRPYWRNCGIAQFMLYHLIQISQGKDITLHVSMDNPALLLYQKFGFKVENVELGFYDKYIRRDMRESKNAFLCRLERQQVRK